MRNRKNDVCLNSPKAQQPWLAAGISRSTWYRRQKKAREQAAAALALTHAASGARPAGMANHATAGRSGKGRAFCGRRRGDSRRTGGRVLSERALGANARSREASSRRRNPLSPSQSRRRVVTAAQQSIFDKLVDRYSGAGGGIFFMNGDTVFNAEQVDGLAPSIVMG